MKIELTNEEILKFFHTALCNRSMLRAYGLEIQAEFKDYKVARKKLERQCLEDVWMQVLSDGQKLKIIDHEREGEYNREVTMQEVLERLPKAPLDHLNDMIKEEDDAITADVLLQTVFFEAVVFS